MAADAHRGIAHWGVAVRVIEQVHQQAPQVLGLEIHPQGTRAGLPVQGRAAGVLLLPVGHDGGHAGIERQMLGQGAGAAGQFAGL